LKTTKEIIMTTATHQVLCQKWEESERGWGTRPDGYSLHLTDADREVFIARYWADMPKYVPDEYSRPSGTAYLCFVDDNTYEEVTANIYGTRFFGSPPGNGGTDGWVPMR
jgi:hypothetical protein